MLNIAFGIINKFWAHNPIFFSRCVLLVFAIRFAHNCTPLKYRCSFKIKYLIRHIHLRVVWFMCNLSLSTMIFNWGDQTKSSMPLWRILFYLIKNSLECLVSKPNFETRVRLLRSFLHLIRLQESALGSKIGFNPWGHLSHHKSHIDLYKVGLAHHTCCDKLEVDYQLVT